MERIAVYINTLRSENIVTYHQQLTIHHLLKLNYAPPLNAILVTGLPYRNA